MSDAHTDIFKEEAHELLAELESSLLALEDAPGDRELIARIFRAMHTIKGSGAMFGFDEMAAFTHEIETVYDLVRNGKTGVTKTLIDLTLSACDHIRDMVEEKEDVDRETVDNLTNAFREFMTPAGVGSPAGQSAAREPQNAAEPTHDDVTYRIRFQPDKNIFTQGTNPTLLLDELRALGACTVTAQTDLIPQVDELDPESCYVFWDITLTTAQGIDAIKDVFIFVEDLCRLEITTIDEPSSPPAGAYKKIGEILTERGDTTVEIIQASLSKQKKIGEILVDTGHIHPGRIESALTEQQHVREMREKRQPAMETASTIRVPAERLDRLVNMVGELVTVQSSLSQLSSRIADSALAAVAEEVERLTAELRDNTMSIRMLPISHTFSKFKRLVHDLSAELGKEINLVTEGGETELDKTVIEKLGDPLVHLIRNSIDHGIEAPEVRREKGKPAKGTLRLAALHSGSHVLIHISDDGAGIDVEAVRRKAVDNNIIAADANLSEKEILALIFSPGFSLAKTITSVSGRGVGMDVVKKSIDSLGGGVEIVSHPGHGTTIMLKLPLTLAIIDGLLVRIGASFFVIPLAAIEECVELTDKDVEKAHGRQVIHIRGEMVPYIPLRHRFAISGKAPAIEQIIINRVGDERIGLVVDEVVGEHQTVIKNLGKFYRRIKEVSGATILGDGSVALIIDIPQIMEAVLAEALQDKTPGLPWNGHRPMSLNEHAL